MIDHGKKSLLGIQVDALDYEAAVARFIHAAERGERYTTTALAVHGVMTGALDRLHRFRLNAFDMIVPDGMPVRWGLNWLYRLKLPDRVYGPTLMLKICERASERAVPIYLFGTDANTLELLQKNLLERFPKLQIAGAEPSQFRQLSSDEANSLAMRIRTAERKLPLLA